MKTARELSSVGILTLPLIVFIFGLFSFAYAQTAVPCGYITGSPGYCTPEAPNGVATSSVWGIASFQGIYPDVSTPVNAYGECSGSGCLFFGTSFPLPQTPAPLWYGAYTVGGGGSIATLQYYVQFNNLGQPGVSIDWSELNLSPPIPFGAISFATSSASLFSGFSTTSIAAQCDTGNVFSDALCAAGAFLFIPNPNILVQYVNLPTTEAGNFPFSVIAQVQLAFAGLTASSTSNVPAYYFDFHSIGIGSTTPTGQPDSMGNFLPSFSGLSTSTVLAYIPLSTWDAGQALMAAVLWLGFVLMVWFEVRKKFHHL